MFDEDWKRLNGRKGDGNSDETQVYTEGQGYRKIVDRTFTTPERRLIEARGRKQEARGAGSDSL